MIKTIIYDGKETTVLDIIQLLGEINQKTTAVRVYGSGITIPTHLGARSAYKGDKIIFDTIERKVVIKSSESEE